MRNLVTFTSTMLLLLNADAQFWERTYGGFGDDEARDVIMGSSGTYYVLGTTGSFGIGGDMYLLNLDATGEIIWSRYYGGNGVEVGRSIASDGSNFMLAGSSNSFGQGGYDGYLILTSEDGEIVWETTVGTSEWDFIHAVAYAGDGWIVAGSTYGGDEGGGDAWIVKVNDSGDPIWTKSLGNAYYDEANALVVLPDGTLVIGGRLGVGETSQATVWMISSSGDSVEELVIDELADAVIHDMIWSLDNTILITGRSRTNVDALFITEMETNGEYVLHTYQGASSIPMYGITQDLTGRVLVCGYFQQSGSSSDAFVIIIGNDFSLEEGFTFGGTEDEIGHSILSLTDGFLFVGSTKSYGPGVTAAHVVRTNSTVSTEGAPVIETFDPVSVPTHRGPSLTLHPNPVAPGGTINFTHPRTTSIRSITLSDLTGCIVAHERCNACSSFSLPQIASGSYRIVIELNDGGRSAHSIIVE